MEDYIYELTNQFKEIERMMATHNKRMERDKFSENIRIHASISNGVYQYYYVDEKGTRVYAKHSELDKVRRIVQRDYDIAVQRVMSHDRLLLKNFLKKYDPESIYGVYENLCEAKKRLVTPAIPSNEEFVDNWKSEYQGMRNKYYEEGDYETEAGEMVRSKSEKIIADLLYRKGIPYQYEPELILRDGTKIYPDFAVLNLKHRKTIYWEHLGMMSDEEYAVKNLHKIAVYEKNGYYLGDTLVISMESEYMALNVRDLEKKINKYLI